MSEIYAPTLCNRCFDGNCEDCDGVARLNINGETFFGKCRCNHRRFKKAKDAPTQVDVAEQTKETA